MRYRFKSEGSRQDRHTLADCQFAGVIPIEQPANAVLIAVTEKTILLPSFGKWLERNGAKLAMSKAISLVEGQKKSRYPYAEIRIVLTDAAGAVTPAFEVTAYFSNSTLNALKYPGYWTGCIGNDDLAQHGTISAGRSHLYWDLE